MKEHSYWRSQAFKGLAEAAEATSRDSDLAEFTEFCRLRERGLRRQALTVMDGFIGKARAWPLDKRQSFIRLLMSLYTTDGNMLMPHPLLEGVVLPSLKQWTQEAPADAEPWRWLGILTHSGNSLEKALALDPHDQVTRQILISYILADVSYGVHELPWGYLGSPNDDLTTLNRAEELASGLVDTKTAEPLRNRIGELREIVLNYVDYKASGAAETFQDWAVAHGRKNSPYPT